MFDVRWLNSEDYEQLALWWEDWGWTAPSIEMLPDEGKCGIMVSKGGVNICAGFIYFTQSSIAWCEYTISNRHYREKDRGKAIKELINAISNIAKAQGYKTMFTSSNNKHLMNSFKECGYMIGDEGVTQLIKNL